MAAESAVHVAVRSRPLLESDDSEYNTSLHFSVKDNEIFMQNKSFSYDYVFPPECTNIFVYETAVANRLDHIFNGYNLTIFAYGQTGSGKSYTMGTNYVSDHQDEEKGEHGIIPLSVTDIFRYISSKGSSHFSVKASFLEVYKEEVYDLLNRKKSAPACIVREDLDGIKERSLSLHCLDWCGITSCDSSQKMWSLFSVHYYGEESFSS